MVQKQNVEISTADGQMPTHWILPEGEGPFPAVIVLMEAFGLVPHIEEVAQRLAAEGYATLAPDVYYRALPDNKVGYDELPRAIELMQQINDSAFVEDMRSAVAFLEASGKCKPGALGITGFCMGGRLAFVSAAELADKISAAVPFYGGGIGNHLDQAEKISCPLLMFFADQDGFIPLEEVEKIDKALKVRGKDYRIKRYADADHGFFCNRRASYHQASAENAWEELKAFFARHLR